MSETFKDGYGDPGHVLVQFQPDGAASVRIQHTSGVRDDHAAWIILDTDEAKRLARYLSVLLKGTDG